MAVSWLCLNEFYLIKLIDFLFNDKYNISNEDEVSNQSLIVQRVAVWWNAINEDGENGLRVSEMTS